MSVVACDIFGTTVDWYSGVSAQVASLLPHVDAGALTQRWRDRYLPSMDRVRTGEREWAHLDTLHGESLDDLGIEVPGPVRTQLVRAWHQLPTWPDSTPGLTRIRTRHTTAALSNGGFALLTHLVKTAGLPFDCILSAELARTYKPDPAVYLKAAELLDVPPGEVLMVAAHKWDLDGARAAGLRTAFVSRPAEKGPGREADRAESVTCDLYATDFEDLATQLGV